MGSINSFRGIFTFISSRLLCERREQCGHCGRLTNSKLPKEIKKYRKVRPLDLYFLNYNGEFIELTLTFSKMKTFAPRKITLPVPSLSSRSPFLPVQEPVPCLQISRCGLCTAHAQNQEQYSQATSDNAL